MSEAIIYLKHIEKKLKKAAVLSPRAEAEEIVRHFGRLDRLQLFTGDKKFSTSAKRSIEGVVEKRRKGVPLAHLTGQAPFYGRLFRVTSDTLIPRPETERLMEETLKILNTHYPEDRLTCPAGRGPSVDILDLGTGTGCLAASLTLEWPACRMTALDASKKALSIARKNFQQLGLRQNIKTVESVLFKAFAGTPAKWDVIVSNPPYVPRRGWSKLSREVRSEPRLALDGGHDGLDLIDAILHEAPKYLNRDGWLLLEIGKGQSKKIHKKWAHRAEYASIRFEKDLNGIERIVIARRR